MIRLELLKLWRSRRPWIAVFAVALFLFLMLFGFYTYASNASDGEAEFKYTYENESYWNGLVFALYAFYFGSLLVLPIFSATEGGTQIAGETSTRTMTQLLARPISRRRVFLSKFLVAAGFQSVMVGLLLALGLGIGLLAVGWGDLRLYPGVMQMAERRQFLTQDEALMRFLLAWPAASYGLLAPLSLALWFSVWMRSAVNAVGLAVSTYLVLYVISEVHFFEDLRPWLFTSYSSYWRALFREDIEWRELLEDAGRLGTWTLIFLGLAFRRFRRREEL